MPCIPSFAYKKVIGRLATRNLPVLLAAACGQGGKAGHEEVQPMYTWALNINSKGFTVAQVQVVFFNWCPPKNSKFHPESKFWAKLQFMVWDRGEREFPFPVIPYRLIVLGVSESRESRSLRSHGSHRTLDKSQTNAISVTFCALVEVSWGNLGKATAEKIKRIVIDAIFCPLVQASWGRIWKRKV